MLIKSITLAEAWERSIKEMVIRYKEGERLVPTERGDLSLEANNILLKIDKPLADKRISAMYPYQKFSEDYSLHLFDQGYHKQVYSRITDIAIDNNKKLNQTNEIIKKLKMEWFSRRAVISVWNPFEDIHSEHPPCICLLQFLVRDKRLCLTCTYRSNDAWLCAPADMIAITNMQKDIAEKLDLQIGCYSHFAVSYHIYSSDLPLALDLFEKLT